MDDHCPICHAQLMEYRDTDPERRSLECPNCKKYFYLEFGEFTQIDIGNKSWRYAEIDEVTKANIDQAVEEARRSGRP